MWACAGGIGWAHVLCALFVPGVTFGVSSASDDRNQTLSGGVHINDDIDSDVDDKVLVGASKMATKRPHAAVSPSFRSSLPLLGTNAEEDVIHGLTNLPVSYLGQECSLVGNFYRIDLNFVLSIDFTLVFCFMCVAC